jgi:hypothetical protein
VYRHPVLEKMNAGIEFLDPVVEILDIMNAERTVVRPC